ncbi:MAG: HAD family hydrolase [Lachnospiraceae bacterium]|nr:HAD family hydrolase [Lachnospiraceae bacterium]
MYQVVLFDLDGTLTDPGLGITNSVMYALKKWEIEVGDRSELYRFIGPPLQESFERFFGFSQEKAKQSVEYYREYFREKGLFENEVYEGIKELLETLKTSGCKLILATSKPEEFAIRILEHFQLKQYFDFIGGASMDGVRSKKADVISYALEKAGIEDLSKTVMVGDREHDILGAKEVGIDSIGVLFGYGNYEELKKAGATHIVNTVSEISSVIL